MNIKNILICITIFLGQLFSQKSFSWLDTTIQVGQKKVVYGFYNDLGGPCSVEYCYNFFNNHFYYDTIVKFLKNNPLVKIEIQSYNEHRENNDLSLKLTTYRAESIYNELIRQGINADRLSFKGYGSNNPIIPLKELSKIKPKKKRMDTSWLNRRIELLIIP